MSGEVKQCERGDKDLLKDKNSRRSVRSAPDADELSLGEFLERPYPGWGETYGNKCGWYSIVCQIIIIVLKMCAGLTSQCTLHFFSNVGIGEL